ncbi:MAG TPA: polysaccharide deacetylase family protein [Candidatus Saccharimonadales bacterium]|nr:polysaccharide deacetylase family protein [Candidatus Saccharimonadales bacterium]
MKRGVAFLGAKLKASLLALLVWAVVLVVPAYWLIQFSGVMRFFPIRHTNPLPAFVVRPADAVSQPPQLFKEALLTVTFDDGWESVYTQAMPLLQKDGIHTTQYVLSGTESNHQYMSWGQIAVIQQAGHEIACHSVTHPDLTKLSDKDLQAQLNGCLHTMTQRFGSITDFASPYGSENDKTLNAIAKLYQSQRNTNGDASNGVTDADVNLQSNFNRYDIIGVTIHRDTTVAQLQSLISYAQAHNGWVVLTYHQADEEGSQYTLDQTQLAKQLDFLSKSNIRIVTMNQALASLDRKGTNQ